jgi:integrase/recombinase XerD
MGAVSFPANPLLVARYVDILSATMKGSSIRRHLVTIRRLHQLAGEVDPTLHVDVFLAIRRAIRRKSARPDQALGITAALRDRMMTACGDDLRGLRDRALLAVGFETLSRGSEVVALSVEDLERNLVGGHSILVRRGKTDQAGYGRMISLSTSATSTLVRWLSAANLSEGPAFRPIYHETVVPRRLNMHTVSRILKERAQQAGLLEKEVKMISSHSLRVGAATTTHDQRS